MSKFIAASRQAIELDKMRVLLETRIWEVREESQKWSRVAAQAKEKTTELQKLIEELKIDAVEKRHSSLQVVFLFSFIRLKTYKLILHTIQFILPNFSLVHRMDCFSWFLILASKLDENAL